MGLIRKRLQRGTRGMQAATFQCHDVKGGPLNRIASRIWRHVGREIGNKHQREKHKKKGKMKKGYGRCSWRRGITARAGKDSYLRTEAASAISEVTSARGCSASSAPTPG
ncbi:uncharacterized protein LOC142796181 [Rhipicephalus microplus]|uniref:uncharacterized protein LOC142796181 n=1 Tax=Rhipicephalus microplus TaxID=6941 RepID=UPI003F6B972F